MSLSRRGLPLLFCLALLGLYLTPALAQGPTPLTYQFKQGDKLEYVIEHIAIMKVIDGAQVDFLSTASTIEVAWEVKEVDKEGRAKLACLLKRLRLEVTASEDPNQKSMLLLDTADDHQG